MNDALPNDAIQSTAWRRFSVRMLGTAMLAVTLIAAMNVTVDPYSIFQVVPWRTSGYTDNERFNKMRHLLSQPGRYDSLIVGSSRMGLYDPSWFNQARPGQSFYNLSVFGGDAGDALAMVSTLQRSGQRIVEVVMGIDVIAFMASERAVTPAYRHHPAVTGQSSWTFYMSYVFVPSLTHSILKVVQNSSGTLPDIEFNHEGDGRYRLPAWDERSAHDRPQRKPTDFASARSAQKHIVRWNEAAFRDLRKFVEWGAAHGARVTLFIDPHHHTMLDRIADESLAEWIARVTDIAGPIQSFMRHEDWSSNDAHYYEPKHYRPELAERVVRLLLPPRDARSVSRARAARARG